MSRQPLLSICIPTRNRAEYLSATLESIVGQVGFADGDETEVVISDNCSDDETAAVAERFRRSYGERIRYFRQETPLAMSQSFSAALDRGRGEFLKLNNDTLMWRPGTLSAVLETIRRHSSDRSVLWFDNRDGESDVARTMDELIGKASYWITWIGSFGLWREDFDHVRELFVDDRTLLPQVKALLELSASGRKVVIERHRRFHSVCPTRKGGYNVAEVFGWNYLGFFRDHLGRGQLSAEVYEREKRDLLLKHINYFYFDLRGEYAFDKTGYFKWLLPFYWRNPYFYLALPVVVRKWLRIKRKALFCKLRGVKKGEGRS